MHDDLSGAAGSLAGVVEQGEYRASLEALRDRLAAGIDSLTPRQMIHLAPLSKQLSDVLKVLAELPEPDAAADSVENAQEDVERILRAVQ
jgi:hypothetical protein